MGVGLGQLIVILLIILVLFGAGKLPQVMGDLGKGFKAFKKNADEDKNSHKTIDAKASKSEEDK